MIMPELSSVFSLVNYAFVLFFGIVAALYLADIGFCDHKRVYVLTLFFFGIAQLLFYLIMGESVLYKCYPFLIHIPLIALIFLRFHRNLSISAISVLSAYLLCTPRKWFGTFVAFFFDRNPVVSNIASIIITIPLLVLVIRFVSPYIIRLKYESRTTLLLFFLLPLVYYVLEYTFTVYTDLLYTGGAVVIDFMDSFLVVSFFILSVLSLKFSSEKNKAERENILLTTAATQAQKEIAQLSASQQQAAIYRHDLRHHMNFIQSCLDQNNPKEATSYIHEICTNLEHSSVIRYCVNESVNLIVSSYANQAAINHIPMQISITATEFSRFQITDLCSLFANALENALHACQQMNPQSQRYISLKVYEKNTQLCIQIKNSYEQPVVFADDIPISRSVGHRPDPVPDPRHRRTEHDLCCRKIPWCLWILCRSWGIPVSGFHVTSDFLSVRELFVSSPQFSSNRHNFIRKYLQIETEVITYGKKQKRDNHGKFIRFPDRFHRSRQRFHGNLCIGFLRILQQFHGNGLQHRLQPDCKRR